MEWGDWAVLPEEGVVGWFVSGGERLGAGAAVVRSGVGVGVGLRRVRLASGTAVGAEGVSGVFLVGGLSVISSLHALRGLSRRGGSNL